jgi:hypothetical protein
MLRLGLGYYKVNDLFFPWKKNFIFKKKNIHGLELDPFQKTTTYHISTIHVPIYKTILTIHVPTKTIYNTLYKLYLSSKLKLIASISPLL